MKLLPVPVYVFEYLTRDIYDGLEDCPVVDCDIMTRAVVIQFHPPSTRELFFFFLLFTSRIGPKRRRVAKVRIKVSKDEYIYCFKRDDSRVLMV